MVLQYLKLYITDRAMRCRLLGQVDKVYRVINQFFDVIYIRTLCLNANSD